ncbi:MAG TPA: thioesterase family protein [Micromonosporaceae bacterium]
MTSSTITLNVEWSDTDAAGHHHHASVARWVEAAEAALYRTIGYPQLMTLVPRVAYQAEYLDRLFYQDSVDVTLTVRNIGNSSLTYAFEVRRSDDDVLAARGSYTVVHIGELQGRGAPWPDDLRALLSV